MVVLLTRIIWYWLQADESCLLFTRYILQVRWINL